ncbi:MAG TPA: prenyltransferase/squalene oxidase repeat-containing protein [Marmoricola sp.]|nr:prenyltransferase/squalene oxidase repeat-containing protein [Marmoricola sp.]
MSHPDSRPVGPRRWSTEIRSILDRERENGGPFWSRADGNIHAPAGLSTLLVLNVLGELGVTRATDPSIAGAIDLLFRNQTDDGAFRYSANSSRFPCITGQALAALGRLGLAGDQRAEAGYRWLLEQQWSDAGWRCATVKLGRSPETDASNPGATLFVLDAFRFRDNTREDETRLAAAAGTLLDHWETRSPLGPCTFGIGTRFAKVEYPFWRYNLFYYVHVLSHLPQVRDDPRFLDAVEQLRGHTDADGHMVVDAPPRAWQRHSFSRPGTVSMLATERWEEIRRNVAAAP